MSARVKIRFSFTDASGNTEIETMWAVTREDGYELDNIPFYVKELALGDVVSVPRRRTEPCGTRDSFEPAATAPSDSGSRARST